MLNEELSASGLEMRIRRKHRSTLDEAIIRSRRIRMRCSASIIQGSENTRRSLLFDQVAHDLVIEVLDWRPLDLFPDILLLLSLERQFDENLLQLLVDIIDAELLKRVVVENLKAEDILQRNSYSDFNIAEQKYCVPGYR